MRMPAHALALDTLLPMSFSGHGSVHPDLLDSTLHCCQTPWWYSVGDTMMPFQIWSAVTTAATVFHITGHDKGLALLFCLPNRLAD